MKLFLHAPNIHQGGGAVLLNDLMRAIPADLPTLITLDERMEVSASLPDHVDIMRVRPSVGDRFRAERWLSDQVKGNDRVLCFGNLPPLFKLKCDVSVFLQNRYLIDDWAPLRTLPLKPQIRLRMERIWLSTCRHHARRYFVQTPSMQRLTEKRLNVPVSIAPLVPENILSPVEMPGDGSPARYDFIYVASGERHKNHAALINAWGMLADEGVFPSLALTLSPTKSPEIVNQMEVQRTTKGVKIDNLGVLPHEHLLALYRDSKALIYPSEVESFGLPLIEAKIAGLPVLAPELDYVRDVLDPVESFHPSSPLSIARAVKRFLKKDQPPYVPIGARSFINSVIE